MKRVMFVCLGNICRSPIAEGCAKKYIQEHNLQIEASSAGTSSYHIGESPCPHSIEVAKEHDVDISSLRASQFTQAHTKQYDLVVALDAKNYSDLKSLGVEHVAKLGSYGYEGADVPDPYFFDGFEGFEKVFSMIESCVINLLESDSLLLKTK